VHGSEKHKARVLKNSSRTNNMGELAVDERIILMWKLETWGMGM
jgi:hypothetical protein